MDHTGTDGNIFSLHKLASIGMVQSFGQNREHFFYRRDMKPESLRDLVERFVAQMEKSREDMVALLPKSILDGWKKYSTLVHSLEFTKFSPEAKTSARRKLKMLNEILKLPLYSWFSVLK